MIFLVLAQPLGMRFDYAREENLRLLDIVLPTFFGYLGAASHFLFNASGGREISAENTRLVKLLVHGPFLIFTAVIIALFFAHYVSHVPLDVDDPRRDVMTFNQLSRYLSIALSLLAATVGVISGYLFGAPRAQRRTKNKESIERS